MKFYIQHYLSTTRIHQDPRPYLHTPISKTAEPLGIPTTTTTTSSTSQPTLRNDVSISTHDVTLHIAQHASSHHQALLSPP